MRSLIAWIAFVAASTGAAGYRPRGREAEHRYDVLLFQGRTLPTGHIYRSVGHDAVDERRRTGSSTRPSLPAPIPIGSGGACT